MYRRLVLASALFLAANVVHGVDHVRTGTERLTVPVFWGGGVITLVAVAMLVLALRRHPRAPLIATAFGFTNALVVANAHLLPNWGVFSDSYLGGSFDAFSWTAVIAELLASLVLGSVGALDLRRQSARQAAGRWHPPLRA